MAADRSGSSPGAVRCAALCARPYYGKPALRPCHAKARAFCVSKPGHPLHPFQAPLCGLHQRARTLVLRAAVRS